MVVNAGMQPVVVVEADITSDCNLELAEGVEGLAADRDAFMKMGMAEGWAQSLERIEALVAKV